MFNLGGEKIFVLLLIALVVLGPERLPEMARKVGGWVRTAKSMAAGFEQELRDAVDVTTPVRTAVDHPVPTAAPSPAPVTAAAPTEPQPVPEPVAG